MSLDSVPGKAGIYGVRNVKRGTKNEREEEIALRADGMRVLLTADRTLMSNHRQNEFLGFGATAPPNVVPEWIYKQLFFPPIKTNSGMPVEAPYGLRKVEARLMNEGFSVLTVDPDHASTTFARILRTGETYTAKYFRTSLEKPDVERTKKPGLKIIVGGLERGNSSVDRGFSTSMESTASWRVRAKKSSAGSSEER